MKKAKQKNPNFREEKKLWRRGYKFVVGLDEAGRGPLAGPVCAAAVCFCLQKQTAAAKFKVKSFKLNVFDGIRDSKKLTTLQRERWYKILTKHPEIKWGIGMISEKIIDKINILEATKLAMKKAVKSLNCKLKIVSLWEMSHRDKDCKIDFMILDGKTEIDLSIPQRAIIKADEKIFSCAVASIIAKVTRDRLMIKYHKKFPQYGFDRHKGYGTKKHFEAIKKHGPCGIHRLTFKGCQK